MFQLARQAIAWGLIWGGVGIGIVGCTSGARSPLAPATPASNSEAIAISAAAAPSDATILGTYAIRASVDPLAFEVIPARRGEALADGSVYAADVTRFFRNDCPDCFAVEGLSAIGDSLEAVLRLRHPFNLPAQAGSFGAGERLDLHVFDAMLLVHNRTDNGFTTNFPVAGERLEPGFLTWGLNLTPADGYTDVLEPWFEEHGFSNAATLDPYIIFSRSPMNTPTGNFDPEKPNGFADLRTATGYNSLRAGEERTLRVQMHLGTRTSVNLQIALLASYQNKSGLATPTGLLRDAVRQRPVYQLPAGNLAAPWRVQARATPLDLSLPGRTLQLTVETWDWQHAALVNQGWTPDALPRNMVPYDSGLWRIAIEIPGLLESERLYTEFNGDGRGLTPLTKSVEFAPDIIPPAGTLQALITAIDKSDVAGQLLLDRSSIVRAARVRTWQTMPIEVLRAPFALDASTLAVDAVTGIPIAHQFRVSGGVPPFHFVATGPLPTWGLLNQTTGVLSGTPDVPLGTFSLGLKVSDSGNPAVEVSAGWTLKVRTNGGDVCDEPDPSFVTAPALPDGQRGVAYAQTLEATGGRPPLLFQLAPGSSLPAGLALSTNGVISGVPTVGSTGQDYACAITVSDACPTKQTGTQVFTLSIPCAPLEILTKSLDPISAGQRPPPLEAHGESPMAWSIVTGASALAAAGLSLNADGSFGGLALSSAQGTYIVFTVRATDQCATGTPVSAMLTLPISCAAAPVISPVPPPPMAWQQPYAAQLNASGGQGSLTWTLLTPTSVPTNFLMTSDGHFTVDPPINTEGGTTWHFLVHVADSCPASQTTTLQVALEYPCPSTPQITTPVPPVPAIGTPTTLGLSATVGTGQRTWFAKGTLPPGLSFNPNTATLSGTPGAGAAGKTYTFTLSVSDECGLAWPPDDTLTIGWTFP